MTVCFLLILLHQLLLTLFNMQVALMNQLVQPLCRRFYLLHYSGRVIFVYVPLSYKTTIF